MENADLIRRASEGDQSTLDQLSCTYRDRLQRMVEVTAAAERQEQAGPLQDVCTTMISTHVLNRGGRGIRNPLDRP